MTRSTGARTLAGIVLLCAAGIGCSRPAPHFSTANARAHVTRLAGTIGPRPAGSDANRRAREYLVEQLRFFGFAVRIQEAEGRQPQWGLTGRVANIIAIRPGATPDAIAVVAHYDSVPIAPGASDDAFGVAVCLEVGRLVAAQPNRRHTFMVLLTDAEENGLLGAAALIEDPEVRSRLRAYVNVEATGSDGPAVLFESGPGNGWLVRAFARAAPAPYGSSMSYEVYRRLPNDTDFSVLKRTGAPGLNVAAVGDSYPYHTPRDVPERLTDRVLENAGGNVLATVGEMDSLDLDVRTAEQPVFFDLSATRAVVLAPEAARALGIAALLIGLAGWIRAIVAALGLWGLAGLLRTAAWAVLGVLAAAAAAVGAAALLRAVREVYHPWYAHPDRFWLLLLLATLTAARVFVALGRRLPERWWAVRHPVFVWVVALPAWVAVAAVAEWNAPAASYLWTLPLLCAGVVALVGGGIGGAGAAVGGTVVLAVAGAIWIPQTREIMRFVIPLLGRLPLIVPVAMLPAVLVTALLMVAPPAAAVLASRERPGRRREGVARLAALSVPGWLVVSSAAFAWCYASEAYTRERPLWRHVQYVADHGTNAAAWEVGGNEPGLDLHLAQGAPAGWRPARGELVPGGPVRSLPHPFSFRASAPLAPAALQASGSVVPQNGALRIEIRATTTEPGGTILFLLPPGVVPARPSLPGIVRDGWWRAMYSAAPAGTVAFTATVPASASGRLSMARAGLVTSELPGGIGWLRQPPWLGQERSIWHSRAVHLIPVTGLAVVPALR